MTRLNDTQERILQAVTAAFADTLPVLKKMEEDYEYAVYRAKKSLREAVEDALENGVPLKRLSLEAAGFKYPQKLKLWLEPSEELLARLSGDAVLQTSDQYADDVESIRTVVRNPKTGEFEVTYKGEFFSVSALGPDAEPWSSRDTTVPQGVYDLITDEYPAYVVLEEDD